MTFRRLLLPAVLFSAGHLFAASKEIIELQRDVAQIQDQLRNLQRSQDEKLSALTVLVQQALDAANKANTSVAVLESGIRQNLKDQEKSVVAPVAGVGLKIDQMTTDFQSLRDSVADVSARMGKLQQQIIDHYRPLPQTPITTPVRDTLTGAVRQEQMALYSAVPPERRVLQLNAVPGLATPGNQKQKP